MLSTIRYATIVLLLVLSPLLVGTETDSTVSAYSECNWWDTACSDDQDDCARWDNSCDQSNTECDHPLVPCSNTSSGTWSSNQREASRSSIEYTVEVECSLVLAAISGGVSGYCDYFGPVDLDHCIVSGTAYLDDYSVSFLCSKSRPAMMAEPSRDEVSIENLSASGVFGEPFWIVCDEDMGNFSTNAKCYDSEFSDGDDWKYGCTVEDRVSDIPKSTGTFVWYVCS